MIRQNGAYFWSIYLRANPSLWSQDKTGRSILPSSCSQHFLFYQSPSSGPWAELTSLSNSQDSFTCQWQKPNSHCPKHDDFMDSCVKKDTTEAPRSNEKNIRSRTMGLGPEFLLLTPQPPITIIFAYCYPGPFYRQKLHMLRRCNFNSPIFSSS